MSGGFFDNLGLGSILDGIGSIFGSSAPSYADSGTLSLGGKIAPSVLEKTIDLGSNPATSSIFSNPSVVSSGILAGTSLLSGLFGDSGDDINYAQLEEQKRQADLDMAYKTAALAQALEIAKMQAASQGGGGNGAGVAAQLKIARANAIANNTAQKAEAMQIPLAARSQQAQTAQNTGTQSGAFFNNLISLLQAPAIRRS